MSHNLDNLRHLKSLLYLSQIMFNIKMHIFIIFFHGIKNAFFFSHFLLIIAIYYIPLQKTRSQILKLYSLSV